MADATLLDSFLDPVVFDPTGDFEDPTVVFFFLRPASAKSLALLGVSSVVRMFFMVSPRLSF